MKNLFKKMGNYLSNAKEFIFSIGVSIMMFMMSMPVFADSVGSSRIATGTQNLISDVTTWLLVIAPIVTIVAVGYYFIRKAISDEMDHKKWNTRITTAIISCVGVITASILINLVLNYYR